MTELAQLALAAIVPCTESDRCSPAGKSSEYATTGLCRLAISGTDCAARWADPWNPYHFWLAGIFAGVLFAAVALASRASLFFQGDVDVVVFFGR